MRRSDIGLAVMVVTLSRRVPAFNLVDPTECGSRFADGMHRIGAIDPKTTVSRPWIPSYRSRGSVSLNLNITPAAGIPSCAIEAALRNRHLAGFTEGSLSLWNPAPSGADELGSWLHSQWVPLSMRSTRILECCAGRRLFRLSAFPAG
ncbi:hypothetical protein DFH06DRAFT_381705 [Mycena polygramma]|nr:hypothetical protein DFH06DRAFT_381705 [Mycena polygramma]